MAIKSRTNYDPWESPRNTADVESRIDAYIQPMKGLNQALELGDEASVREVAREWIDQHERGVLRPLPPCSYVDSTRDGVKGQITLGKNRLTYRLIDQSDELLAAGRTSEAISDALLAYKVANVLKFSDFTTVYDTCRAQLRVLKTLEDARSRLGPEQKKEVRHLLAGYVVDVKPLNRILLQSRRLYTESLQAKGQESLPIEDTQQFTQIGNVLQARCDAESLQSVRRLIVASNGDMPRILTTAKLAWQMENQLEKASKTLLEDL
ncbi:MAG: hypothetical protein K1X67_01850 [Fimbriimonadaceae bacterium]|nr:hypothetical protein [Fimbriimonadaceae bacterium]